MAARTKSFSNAFKLGQSGKRKGTSTTAPATVLEDPNLIIANLSDLPENSVCADCSQQDPRFLSSTLGVWLCKECSTFHKEILGAQFSDIRSLDLGLAFWTPETIKFLQSMGNAKANSLWEHSQKSRKPTSDAPKDVKEKWIISKYQLMEYWKQQRDYLNVKIIQLVQTKGAKKTKPTWVRRWCVLKWDFLEFYEAKEKENEPLEKLDLMFLNVKECDHQLLAKDKKINPDLCIQCSTTDKIYIIQCDTAEVLDEWLFAIRITAQRLRIQITTQKEDKIQSNNKAVPAASVSFTQAKLVPSGSGTRLSQVGLGAAAAASLPANVPIASSPSGCENIQSLPEPTLSLSPTPAAPAPIVAQPSPAPPASPAPPEVASLSAVTNLGLSSSRGSLVSARILDRTANLSRAALGSEEEFVLPEKLRSPALLATLAHVNDMKEQERKNLRVKLEKITEELREKEEKRQQVEKKLAELEKLIQENTVKSSDISLRLVQLEPASQMVLPSIQRTEDVAVSSAASNAGLIQKEDGSIHGGTVAKLVQMLTHETYLNTEYLNAFMLTYRSFTTPLDLMAKLQQRFQIQPPPFITDQDLKRFQDTMQKPIRLRVFNVLKHWIQHHYYDFEIEANLTHKLLDLLDECFEPAGMTEMALRLKGFLREKIKGQSKQMQVMLGAPIPKPILPPSLEKFTLLELDCLEIARQMCIVEQALYKAILPRECLNQAWNNKTYKETAAPNILAIIRRFNRVSAWVAEEIVRQEFLSDRIKILEKIILIAVACRELRNFNATQSILAGLGAASVFRMKKTWAGVDPKIIAQLEAIKKTMSSDQSFSTLRATLHTESPPLIPYLGMYLTDLTFIEDGNQDFLNKAEGIINYSKRMRVAAVIREIQQYQHTPYALEPVPQLLKYVQGLDGVDEKIAYDLSLLVEPREKAAS